MCANACPSMSGIFKCFHAKKLFSATRAESENNLPDVSGSLSKGFCLLKLPRLMKRLVL